MTSKLRDSWEHIYRVIPYPRYDAEYEITNWYTRTHPDAPYRQQRAIWRSCAVRKCGEELGLGS